MKTGKPKTRRYPDRNLLAKERSPYLLQHADNPVHWYPWSEAAFAKAKAENKPVFLSIGYSTCHWCHVMAHESFENPDMAEVLNKFFVAIKVDREERPDLDNIYMKAVMSLTGSGGWPLSVFLTADRKPFYGGTYFPPVSVGGHPGFREVLLAIHEAWQNKRDDLIRSSHAITHHLQEESAGRFAGGTVPDEKTLQQAYNYYAQQFDSPYGGFGGAPKFPASHNLSFLLRYWKRTGEPRAMEMVEKTLTAMAHGGMYDHLGGGFHRYATDQRWFIPHFEKMLYDQAVLSWSYLEAYQATHHEEYARIAREIFGYVLRDMTDSRGGFYSARDADSLPPGEGISGEKKEGAFYLWTHQEIIECLGQESVSIFSYCYGVEPEGNAFPDPHGDFSGKNILYLAHSPEETARTFGQTSQQIRQILSEAKKKLMRNRSSRPQPHLDDKVLVDWNGLMISSLAFGSRVLEEPAYGQAAEKSARFLLATLVGKDGRLLHRYRDRDADIPGNLDDYTFFVQGLIDLYEATFTEIYLKEARRLTEEMIEFFWDEKEGGFFFAAADAEGLLFREKTVYDGAVPSGNAVAALNLLRLGRLTLNRAWEQKARDYFRIFADLLSSSPGACAQSLIALDFVLGPSREIVLAGAKDDPQTHAMLKSLYGRFIPNKVVMLRPSSEEAAAQISSLVPFVKDMKVLENRTTAYVCRDYQCRLPTNDIRKFEELLEQ